MDRIRLLELQLGIDSIIIGERFKGGYLDPAKPLFHLPPLKEH